MTAAVDIVTAAAALADAVRRLDCELRETRDELHAAMVETLRLRRELDALRANAAEGGAL